MRILILIILTFLTVSCTQQRKIKKASNKVFQITERYPSLIQKEVATQHLNYQLDNVKLETKDIIPLNKLKYNEIYTIKDSINIITVVNEKDSLVIETITNCPPMEVDTIVQFEYQNIVAESNCKKEVKEKTKYLKRTNWLLIIIVMSFFINGIRKFFI